MKIKQLELKGYKRLSLNNIDYIKFTPENKIQLILGQNGSGKSSLLKELSPLPALPIEFNKEGYKVVEILHNNSNYILKSIFSSLGNKFHFIKDSEELNPGSTVTVFKELVKKHFNISNDVHDLLTGTNSFHRMSVGERRNWFTRLSESDYTYAFSIYQNLREQQRDIQGAIKLNQSRLLQESQKLLIPEQEVIVRDEIKNLNELLYLMLSYKTPNTTTESQILNVINNIENNILDSSNKLSQLRNNYSFNEGFSSIEDIDNYILNTRVNISDIENQINKLCKSMMSDNETMDIIKKSNLESINNISEQQDVVNNKIHELKNSLHFNITKINDPISCLNSFVSIKTNLIQLFSSIDANPIIDSIRVYSRHNKSSTDNDISVLEQQIKKSILDRDTTLIKLKELIHLKDHDLLTCPKCEHTWYTRYNALEHKQQQEQLDWLVKDIESKESKLNKLKNYIDKYIEYSQHLNEYLNIKRNWPILTDVFIILENSLDIFEEPRKVLNILQDIQTDLDLLVQIDNFNKKASELNELNIKLNTDQALSIEDLQTKLLNDEKTLSLLMTDKTKANNYLQHLFNNKELAINITNIKNELENLLKAREEYLYKHLDIARQSAINNYIQTIQLELSKREQLISRVDIQNSIVINIENQIKELEEKHEVLKIATKELSPTEGLIAKGLTGFINHFVQQVNSFIKKIWLYPLELIPVVPDEDEELDLDYKFMVKINDNNIIPDINKASSAMKEVIDLAFRLVAMQYLHLTESPIYLDELGSSFDKNHREAVVNLIKTLSIANDYSQIFIISHYQEMYGSFINSDITMLNRDNINMNNSAFNKHVIIN
jgi:energy-coupling factor transporter ATP-binding protein EcfA2